MTVLGNDRPCNLNREGPLLPIPSHLLSVVANNSCVTGERLSDGGYYNRPRPDFPIFNGKDVHGWLYQVEQLLDFYGIRFDQKVRMAVLYLEEKPL